MLLNVRSENEELKKELEELNARFSQALSILLFLFSLCHHQQQFAIERKKCGNAKRTDEHC